MGHLKRVRFSCCGRGCRCCPYVTSRTCLHCSSETKHCRWLAGPRAAPSLERCRELDVHDGCSRAPYSPQVNIQTFSFINFAAQCSRRPPKNYRRSLSCINESKKPDENFSFCVKKKKYFPDSQKFNQNYLSDLDGVVSVKFMMVRELLKRLLPSDWTRGVCQQYSGLFD